MNHNDINRQCAEAMGWKSQEETNDTCPMFWMNKDVVLFLLHDGAAIKCYDFCTDWNAMRILVEYAESRNCPLELCIEHGAAVANFDYTAFIKADTAPLATALAFRKCFGEKKADN